MREEVVRTAAFRRRGRPAGEGAFQRGGDDPGRLFDQPPVAAQGVAGDDDPVVASREGKDDARRGSAYSVW